MSSYIANAAASGYCFSDLQVDDEFSNIDCSLLVMSLLEDSPDDGDDELLRSMIESLDQPDQIMSHDSCSSSQDFRVDDHELESCSSTSPDQFDHQWIDMEMADEINGYFVSMAQLEGLEDFSQASYGFMSMDIEDDYIGLWQ